jgi:hypothetical protein
VAPTELHQPLRERGELRLGFRIVFFIWHKHADPADRPTLLRARHHRPRHSASEPSDERPPSHLRVSFIAEPIAAVVPRERDVDTATLGSIGSLIHSPAAAPSMLPRTSLGAMGDRIPTALR